MAATRRWRCEDTRHMHCAQGVGAGGHGVVWAVFNLVSGLGADKSLKSPFPMIHAVMAWTESDRKSQ